MLKKTTTKNKDGGQTKTLLQTKKTRKNAMRQNIKP